MIKKVLTAFLAVMLGFSGFAPALVLPVQAEEETDGIRWITDTVPLLSEEQLEEMESRIDEIEEKIGYGIYIIDVGKWRDNSDYENIAEYAKVLYAKNKMGSGPDKKGILLVVSADDGEYSFTSNCLDHKILEEIKPKMLEGYKNGGWPAAFDAYINASEEMISQKDQLTPWIQDEAGLLTDSQKQELDQQIAETAKKYNFGIYILTVKDWPDSDNKEIVDYAKEYYKHNGLGIGPENDGMLLVVSTGNRYYAITSDGPISEADYDISIIEGQVVPYLSDDDWYGGLKGFVGGVERFLKATGAKASYGSKKKSGSLGSSTGGENA